MKTLIASGISLVALSTAFSAHANEPWPKWYVGINGSIPFVSDVDFDGIAPGDGAEYDAGWGVGVSLGYMLPMGLRTEIEGTYRHNDNDSFRILSTDFSDIGKITSSAYMANVYYDVPLAAAPKWTPYVGGGIGMAKVEIEDDAGGNDDDSVFAYQGMAGIAYAPETMPMTQWSMGYRYFATSDVSFDSAAGPIEAEYDVHNIEFGGRFRF